MDIERKDTGDEKLTKIRSINEEFEIADNFIMIRSRDVDAAPLGKVMFKEIKNIAIKPAGTLYDGEVKFELVSGNELKFAVKKYQQEDFELLKKQIGK